MSKKYIISFGVLLIILTLVISPNVCISAAKEGLLLWFNKILPSLLPFIVLINILSQINIMESISRIASPLTQKIWKLPGCSLFAFIMGFIAGYPMGAKVTKQLVESKSLSLHQAQKLLCFCNNCGPLFIIGTVGTLMLGNTPIGYFLLIVHILSAVLMSCIFSFYNSSPPIGSRKATSSSEHTVLSFSYIFNEAVKNGMDTVVCIGGYIIFFSVIASIIKSSSLVAFALEKHLASITPAADSLSFIVGLLELSNGTSMLCSSHTTFSVYLLAAIACLIGFGGLCVYFQTSYVLGHCSFSLIPYTIAKIMQGILSFILTCALYPIYVFYTSQSMMPFEIRWLFVLLGTVLLFIYLVKVLNMLRAKRNQRSLKTKYTYTY